MASPFQQQVRQRKLIYIGLIIVLFSASVWWRTGVIAGLSQRLAIRDLDRGDVELTGAVVRLGLTGSRGLATCILWTNAIDKQKKNQWNELEVLVRSLTKLQPHFITPWLFQSWNLAYNVSVESDRVRDKYFYISRGIELLSEGERQNRFHPDLRWSIGFYTQHKICQSDETNYKRSLLQLSLIPPNMRDPARFWKSTPDGSVFNWTEFEKFCKEHPQLVRRLKEGMRRETLREKKKQFTCENPEQVVQFLEENYNVPSLYQVEPLPAGVPASARSELWNPVREDKLLEAEVRFPALPPPHSGAFDPEALTTDSTMRDDTDGFTVSHAWYSYSQEPLPPPSKELPGNPEPIVDRARQRRPRHITTLIFRNYPAQACRYMAERLQQEGWFDDEPWDASEWFSEARLPVEAGKGYRFGGGRPWSLEAWKRAYRAWQEHGEQNLLILSPAEEENKRELSQRFFRRYQLPGGSPPPMREQDMNAEELREYQAAKYKFEYDFYRRVSNFPHHYNRCFVEQREATVACRKLFFLADQLDMAGSPRPALDLYRTPIEVPSVEGWSGKKLSPLEAWRDLVLMRNKEFRRDSYTQENTAEYELRYQRLLERYDGQKLREQLAKFAGSIPLQPRFTMKDFGAPLMKGPFAGFDDEGEPLVSEVNREQVMSRMGIAPRKPEAPRFNPEDAMRGKMGGPGGGPMPQPAPKTK